jgi:hypothetical protein
MSSLYKRPFVSPSGGASLIGLRIPAVLGRPEASVLRRLDNCRHMRPDASSSRQKQQSIPGEVSEKKPPSDAKLGTSSTLPFADWHSKYSQNVRMSTAAQENLQPGKYLSLPDKPLLRYTQRPFTDAFSVTNLGELAPCRTCRDWSGPQTEFEERSPRSRLLENWRWQSQSTSLLHFARTVRMETFADCRSGAFFSER